MSLIFDFVKSELGVEISPKDISCSNRVGQEVIEATSDNCPIGKTQYKS